MTDKKSIILRKGTDKKSIILSKGTDNKLDKSWEDVYSRVNPLLTSVLLQVMQIHKSRQCSWDWYVVDILIKYLI